MTATAAALWHKSDVVADVIPIRETKTRKLREGWGAEKSARRRLTFQRVIALRTG